MATSTDHSTTRRRSPGISLHSRIDLLRGILSWMVVLCHGFATSYAIRPSSGPSLDPSTHALLDHTINAGFVWVMGFFVLSGYCIHRSVERHLASPSFPLRNYLIARLTRILPLYYLALAFAVFASPRVSDLQIGPRFEDFDLSSFVSQVLLIQNLTSCFGTFTPSWSLTNEVFYYILYGVLVWNAGRQRARPFWIGMALCVGLGALLQAFYVSGWKGPLVLKAGLLFGLGFNWFLGVGVALWADDFRRSRWARSAASAWPLILLAAFAGYHRGMPIQAAYLVSGIAFALMMVRMVSAPQPEGGVIEPPWLTRLARFAGLSSYPTYLFHNTFLWVLASLIARFSVFEDWRTIWAVMVGSSLVLGAILGWVAERPLMKWRSELLSRLDRDDRGSTFRANQLFAANRLRKESA